MKLNRRLFFLAACLLPAVCPAREVRTICLQECLEMSRMGNPDVLDASLDTRAARAQKQEAFASWFPSVSFSALGFRALDPMVRIGLEDVLGSSDAANNIRHYASTSAGLAGVNTEWSLLSHGYVAAFNVSQPLFAGGRIANGNALASLGVRAAQVKEAAASRDNDEAVTAKYWTVVSLSEKKKALQQGIDLVTSLRKDVAAAVDAGLARQTDLQQVDLKARELESSMVKLRSGEKLAKMDLFNTIGLEYKILELDLIVLSDGFDALMAPGSYYRDEKEMASLMPESQLLEMSVEAKRLEKKMAVGEGLPEVGIGASAGYGQIVGSPRANGMVYAMVKIPISDWSKTSRKVQRCDYELQKARNRKDFLDRQLVLKANKEWIELECAWDSKLIAEDAVKLSEDINARRLAEYGAGLCTMSELLQSESDLQSARSALVDAQAAYCNALTAYRR